MREIKHKNGRGIEAWKIAFVLLAICAWATLPFITKTAVEASGEPSALTLTAVLRAPNGAINPHGSAAYDVYASGNRELEVEVEDTTAANGTTFAVFVDNAQVGVVGISFQKGKLRLRTEDNQSVPNVAAGATVSIRNGSTVIASGAFGGANQTPSPTVSPSVTPTATVSPTITPSVTPTATPTVTPSPTTAGHLYAALSGATINGVLPRGLGKYEQKTGETELEVYVRQINLPIGTVLTVVVDNAAIGQMTLQREGEARLELENEHGQIVPAVVNGSNVQIKNGATVILSGVFSGASATPNPSPTPIGQQQGRVFEGHLNGAGVVPPVNTAARGEVKVSLNQAETQATITGEYERLSSAQTTAKIQFTTGATTTVVFDLGTVGGREAHFTPQSFAVTAEQVQQLRTGLWYAVVGSVNNPNGEIAGRILTDAHHSDFDGDGRSDLAVFRPSSGAWYSLNGAGYQGQIFGAANDKAVSGDYDGDGKTDAAVYRDVNGSGVWEIHRSSDGGTSSAQFGVASDKPVRGDFDGDGRTDLAVYRPSNGVWYIQKSDNSGYTFVQFGTAEDKPIAADLDGDGKADISVFRPSNGVWYWLNSTDGSVHGAQFGIAEDKPVVGDFDGDGKDDITVFRPSSGVWHTIKSSTGEYSGLQFGVGEDVPVAGNYDGDDKSDIAVFRPSDGTWYILRSVDGAFDFRQFGAAGDIPTPAR